MDQHLIPIPYGTYICEQKALVVLLNRTVCPAPLLLYVLTLAPLLPSLSDVRLAGRWRQIRRRAFLIWNPTQRLRSDIGQALYFLGCRKSLYKLPRSSNISQPPKVLYCVLEEGAVLLEGIQSQWNRTPGTSYLKNIEFSIICQLGQNMFPLAD